MVKDRAGLTCKGKGGWEYETPGSWANGRIVLHKDGGDQKGCVPGQADAIGTATPLCMAVGAPEVICIAHM